MKAVRRYRPNELQLRPPRRIPWGGLAFLAFIAAGIYGWYALHGGPHGNKAYDLVLKSSDHGVEIQHLMMTRVLDEGSPVTVGASIDTRKSEKVRFSFGPGSSLRLAAGARLTLTSNTVADKKAQVVLTVDRGRVWLVQGKDVQWRVDTPHAVVTPEGRVTELRVTPTGDVYVTAWQGAARLVPRDAPDSAVTIPERQISSFTADGTLTAPSDVELTTNDAWLSWNLLETMQRVVKKTTVTE